jgi:hypothetical protein
VISTVRSRPRADNARERSADAILLEDYGIIGGPVTWVASPVILLAIFR